MFSMLQTSYIVQNTSTVYSKYSNASQKTSLVIFSYSTVYESLRLERKHRAEGLLMVGEAITMYILAEMNKVYDEIIVNV
jgi:hypothetical protein